MDIVDFAEKFMDVELKEWQKKHIRTLYDKYHADGDIRIVMPRKAGRYQVYIYMNQRELSLNGSTNDSKQ